jgi:acyl-CoA thioesterase
MRVGKDCGMPQSAFDAATATHRTASGSYQAHVSDQWSIGANANGGYVLALVTNALRQEAGEAHPDPFTITAHYLRPTTHLESADIHVNVVRRGKRHAHMEAYLVQGTERVRVLSAFGNFDHASGPSVVRSTPPALPPPDECLQRRPTADSPVPASTFMDRFDTRMSPNTGWLTGIRTGVPEVLGWTRFADGRAPDVASLPLFADSFPPAVFELAPVSWVPTIELTVHVRGRPAPGWLRARFETRFLIDGYLEEDGVVWDSSDRIVAQSRQLAMLLGP